MPPHSLFCLACHMANIHAGEPMPVVLNRPSVVQQHVRGLMDGPAVWLSKLARADRQALEAWYNTLPDALAPNLQAFLDSLPEEARLALGDIEQ